MNNPLSYDSQDRSVSDNAGERTMLDLLIVLARHKKLVLGLPILSGVAAVLITLAMPNVYLATTQILPPQQSQSTAAAMLGQLGSLAGAAGGALGIKNPSDLYVGLLSSRTVADNLIRRLDLKKHYQEEMLGKTRQMLERNTAIKASKNGLISVEIEDGDPKFAAVLANAYVEELDKLVGTLTITEASHRRIFFERQLQKSKNDLAQTEAALKDTLDTKGLISVDSQSRAIAETVARLRAQITAKEIQLASMKAFVTEDNQQYRRTAQELASMRNELAKLENGVGADDARKDSAKQSGNLDNVKLLRDLKYHQMLYEMLAKQYEAARLDESKDIPVIQVLDKAVEPENKAHPRRARIVISSAVAGLLAAILWSFMSESMQVNRQGSGGRKLKELKSLLGFRA